MKANGEAVLTPGAAPTGDVRECPKMSDPAQSSQLDDSGLNEKHLAAIRLLLQGQSCTQIARALEVDQRTLYRWRQHPVFREELAQQREELWSDATERLRAMVHPALDVLEEDLVNPYDRARFRAANVVLRLCDLRKATPPRRANDDAASA